MLPQAKQSRLDIITIIRGFTMALEAAKTACFPFCFPFVSAEIHDSLFAVLTPVIL